jgi:hypothetical protein
VQDQPLNSDHDEEEPLRFRVPPQPSNNPPGIPPEFVYDPEYDAYFAPGEESTFDLEAFSRNLDKVIEEAGCGGLITADELRAAGALYSPGARRKSRSNKSNQRDLFSDVVEDAGPRPNEPSQAKADTDAKASSDGEDEEGR